MKKYVRTMVFSAVWFASACYADNSTINSATLIQATLTGIPNCLHYKITGMCYWLKCSSAGCNVQTTLKLDHYLPDVVVSVYTQPTNNPWDYASTVVDPPAYKAGQWQLQQIQGMKLGFCDAEDNSSADLNNRFHEVDLIGNPALTVLKNYAEVLLPSAAKPFMPYYSSLLDAEHWRFPGIERFYPGSEVPGVHEIGTIVLHDWGSLYPRNGFVNQPDDAKAAAVDALRASSIITQSMQPHVYKQLTNSCGNHCDVDAVQENSTNTQFQMIYPNIENQCVVFGGSDAGSIQSWEANASIQGDDRYVWILWRHYHGCVAEEGARYLGSVTS